MPKVDDRLIASLERKVRTLEAKVKKLKAENDLLNERLKAAQPRTDGYSQYGDH